jgi:hypothetical protein
MKRLLALSSEDAKAVREEASKKKPHGEDRKARGTS